MNLRVRKPKLPYIFILLSLAAAAQSGQEPAVTYTPINPPNAHAVKAPSVTIAPVPLVAAERARETMVDLNFRVASGFHVNSNTPKSEFLIPTALRMDLPTDIVLGKIEYPPGKDLTFPFSPDETLNVYSGDFTITVAVHPLHSVVPGKYVMHGLLRYQACDNAQCFPPKNLPVSFEVKVTKEPPGPRHYPAQSPSMHN
ncbi:MAG TPA: protein-disulfide reductase DsbD domain-containing protein [Terriglobales bacterium]|nr:protein-disulfide reductase DsbD domain-containing protein [Terriglobales bacterium]